jgi:hypothetical protein
MALTVHTSMDRYDFTNSYGKASVLVLLLLYIPKHHITFTVSPTPLINAHSGTTESDASILNAFVGEPTLRGSLYSL